MMEGSMRPKTKKNCVLTWGLVTTLVIGVIMIVVVVVVRTSGGGSSGDDALEPPGGGMNVTTGPPPLDDRFVVVASRSSEVVSIPQPPPRPSSNNIRQNCPHLQPNLKRWHDASTWAGGNVPTSGSNVTIPPNTKVFVDETVQELLNIVTIPSSSALIFDDSSAKKIEMHVHGMLVKGSLVAGSETCRYQNTELNLVLHGTRPPQNQFSRNNDAFPDVYKGIVVQGGLLELHGKSHFPTWTRLARTVLIGEKELWLQHKVDWEPQQEIVLVTTAVKDSREWHQNEIFSIESIIRDNGVVPTILVLNATVEHNHVANINYQAEVGLLSRTITIQGYKGDSLPTDVAEDCTLQQDRFGNYDAPCPRVTGFGGHVKIGDGGKARVEGVQLFRMGQTNVLGRYPMHFHMLGHDCQGCYVTDSSIHQSYYRCVAIHGTHDIVVSENVAFDVTGHCYYLEDGVEENNTISYNLAAFVHVLGDPATGLGGAQEIDLVLESDNLTLPADVAASGYYIPNLHNNITGNAASGGWAGFAFPVLYAPVGLHRNVNMRPANRPSLQIDGNTAHSSGWWWKHAGAFYSGGSLFYGDDDKLVYNAGRDKTHDRFPCLVNKCDATQGGDCDAPCEGVDRAWNRIANSKTYLMPSSGLNAWSGRLEVLGFEAHDVALGLEGIEAGIWIDELLVNCRTGEEWNMPPGASPQLVSGNGFFWYDTEQEHIVTNATFRSCGFRHEAYNQYDTSPTRGCDENNVNGCSSSSTVFGLLSTSDRFTPEIMQATRNIRFDDCGRRFLLTGNALKDGISTVSARGQNWLDVDGSVSGLKEPTLIGSGVEDAGLWWKVDREVVTDVQAPLSFIKKSNAPHRGLGHIRIEWDLELHRTVGSTVCGNGDDGLPCPALGTVRHYGPMFNPRGDKIGGWAITANPEIVGPVGGFGWLLRLNSGAPHSLKIDTVEVDPDTPLVLGIVYPPETNFNITAKAPPSCVPSEKYSCREEFKPISSAAAVRTSAGSTYHFDRTTGLLTIRIIQPPTDFVGDTTYSLDKPSWHFWNLGTPGRDGIGHALDRFSRDGITLPVFSRGASLEILADCPRWTAYCAGSRQDVQPQPCDPGFEQTAYDTCCSISNPTSCEFA